MTRCRRRGRVIDPDDFEAGSSPLTRRLDEAARRPVAPAPVVAVVGRPNVGKSTLVNRILGRRQAVVEDVPGVTRDRVAYDAQWSGRRFTVVDTGGWEPDAKDRAAAIAAQAEIAASTADVVLFVVDATVGATDVDEAAVKMLRRSAQAGDPGRQQGRQRPAGDGGRLSLWSLGLGQPYPVSALHGRGSGDLLDADPATRCPSAPPVRRGPPARPAPGGAGRPAERRQVAACSTGSPTRSGRSSTRSPAPPSTRSTAWCRSAARPGCSSTPPACASGSPRPAAPSTTPACAPPAPSRPPRWPWCCSTPASRSASRTSGCSSMVTEAGRALVIAFNKWDLVDEDRRYYLDKEIDRELRRIPWAIRLNLSATTGRAVEKLAPALRQALASWETAGADRPAQPVAHRAGPGHPAPGTRWPRAAGPLRHPGGRPRRRASCCSPPVRSTPATCGSSSASSARTFGFEGSPMEISVRARKKLGPGGRGKAHG